VVLPFTISAVKTAYILQGTSVAPLMIAFLIPVVGMLRRRSRHSWRSGPFNLGRLTTPVAVIAAIALLFLAINSLWPRQILYGDGIGMWIPAMLVGALIVIGLLLMTWAHRDGGVHVRHHGHVDRDLDVRVRLSHGGTCASCHRDLFEGDEAFWNPEVHVVHCIACDDVVV
jgi:amino acid transporter